MDKVDGASAFTPKIFEGINITAMGSVVTVGDHNQVKVKFQQPAEALNELREHIRASKDINDTTKLNAIADIETIQTQLAKPEPNKGVITAVWQTIEKTVTMASAVVYVAKAALLIQQFF
ncbi:MAG TPA: hypothetical protein VK658_02020 [Chryseolinea sp.]|nr:hypothetical protein [Chryseolinea sp.]